MLASIISFIIIFSIIVIAHEFGHYIVGRRNGINVTEFFIGMGPTLFSFNKWGTKFSLKLLPIGGACIFEGETGTSFKDENDVGTVAPDRPQEAENPVIAGPDPQPPPGKADDLGVVAPSPGSFLAASPAARFSTLMAGSVFNFILAFVFGLIIVANVGSDHPAIAGVSPGSAAETAGLMPGDEIVRINREKIDIYRQIWFISFTSQGQPLDITYKRDGARDTVTLIPTWDEGLGRYLIGINGGAYVDSKGLEIFRDAFYEVKYGMTSTVKSLVMLFTGRLGMDDVAGPVGIATLVGDTFEAARPYGIMVVVLSLLNLSLILAVNLGVINLLPLPALDGGRLLFVVIEIIRGKPVAPEKEGLVHLAGMVALMILMAVILFNDISRIVVRG